MKAELSPDQMDTAGLTPLHLAARDGHLSTVSSLLKLGAKADQKVGT